MNNLKPSTKSLPLFLATQSTDKKQWDTIKKENSKLTDELSDVYSDMVWDHSLEKITYLKIKVTSTCFY